MARAFNEFLADLAKLATNDNAVERGEIIGVLSENYESATFEIATFAAQLAESETKLTELAKQKNEQIDANRQLYLTLASQAVGENQAEEEEKEEDGISDIVSLWV